MTEQEILLITQSDIIAGQEATYREYIQKTIPLLVKHGGGVAYVGAGMPKGTHHYTNNAVLTFPNEAALEGFLNDPAYKELSALQKTAVENLHTTYFTPRQAGLKPEVVATQAFEHFRHGLATGEWAQFLAMLSDDFTLRFPIGEWKGVHHGKEKAAAFFNYVHKAYPDGLTITNVQTIGIGDKTVMFEFQDEGQLRGQPYNGHVIIALDVNGDKISQYREYFGV